MSQMIQIPQPCHEPWSTMTPDDKGRHCAKCCKSVIDFSDWSTEEITAYLYTQRNTEVCGRLREDQVAVDTLSPAAYLYQVMQSGLDYFKKVAAILLFAMCLGATANAQQPTQRPDTAKSFMLGKMVAPTRPVKQPVKPKPQRHITGLIAPATLPPTPKPVEPSKK